MFGATKHARKKFLDKWRTQIPFNIPQLEKIVSKLSLQDIYALDKAMGQVYELGKEKAY